MGDKRAVATIPDRVPVKWTFLVAVALTFSAWATLVYAATNWTGQLSESQLALVGVAKWSALLGSGLLFAGHAQNIAGGIWNSLKKMMAQT